MFSIEFSEAQSNLGTQPKFQEDITAKPLAPEHQRSSSLAFFFIHLLRCMRFQNLKRKTSLEQLKVDTTGRRKFGLTKEGSITKNRFQKFSSHSTENFAGGPFGVLRTCPPLFLTVMACLKIGWQRKK